MWITKLAIVTTIAYAGNGCASSTDAPSPLQAQGILNPTLAYVSRADPNRDARWAFEHSDFRYLEVGGFGTIVPFIDDNYPKQRDTIKTKYIRGTSDSTNSLWETRANVIANWYAEEYNSTLYSLMHPD